MTKSLINQHQTVHTIRGGTMTTFKILGAILLASLMFAIRASELATQAATQAVQSVSAQRVQPIGYFVETVVDNETDSPKAHATFTRDGETFPAEAGMEVFPGDVVSTPASGGILVAFLNNNTLQLQGDSQATIHGVAELSAANTPQITVNSGHAFAVARSVSDAGFNLDMGDVKQPMARATTVKPASLDIIVTKDASGVYTTNIGVLAGSVVLTPAAGGVPVAMTSLGTALLTFNTATKPASGTVNTGNLTKDQLKALKVGNISETFLKVGKSSVSIKSTIHNSDGSTSKGTITTSLTGLVTKDSWKTTGPNKFSESWSESGIKISVKQTYNGLSFSASLVSGTSAKATIKDAANKQTYTGTATYDSATGIITFVTTKPGKDGSTATYQFNPNGVGGTTFKTVVTGGTGAGTFQTVVAPAAPPAATPDPNGRLVTQNMPPKSQ